MFEVVFLGTSASAPSIHRGLSATMVLYKNRRFLIDCGEGTQRQILRSGLGFKRLDHILLTHDHLDHILGLGGLASTLGRWEALERINIYGGARTLDRVKKLLLSVVFGNKHFPINLELHPLQANSVIVEDGSFKLQAFPVTHRGTDSFGYLFQEKSRRRFLNDKAQQLGVPNGPERRHLIAGQSITLADGRVVEPDEVLGPQIPGAKLVHVGDTGRIDDLVVYAQDADALIIEATYLSDDAETAAAFSHLTAAQAAQLACQANVGHLFLTHISRRYQEHEILAEAQTIFSNTTVARDLNRFLINPKGEQTVVPVTETEG